MAILAVLIALVLVASTASDAAAAGDGTRGISVVAAKKKKVPRKKETYAASHALVIGIDEYHALPKLTGAVRDAKAMSKLLENQGFQVTMLLNEKATLNEIKRQLMSEMPKQVGENDRVLIYFAGHGVPEGEGSDEAGYLMPVEAAESWQGFEMTAVMDELRRRYKARHILYLADACYSGLGLSTRAAPKSAAIPGYLRQVSQSEVQLQFTAGGKGQQVNEYTGKRGTHGLFTYHLLAGLEGGADMNTDKVVTSAELWAYLQQHVAATAERKGWDQTPQYGREGEGEFLFFLGDEAPPARLLLLQKKAGLCNWSIENPETGQAADFFSSKDCPSEIIWRDDKELYFVDGEKLYSLGSGKTLPAVVSKPDDPSCTDWNQPFFGAKGQLVWACMSEGEVTEKIKGDTVKVCSGEFCTEDDFWYTNGIPGVVRVYGYDGTNWALDRVEATCFGAGGCPRFSLAVGDGDYSGSHALTRLIESERNESTECISDVDKSDPVSTDASLGHLLGVANFSGDDCIGGVSLGEDWRIVHPVVWGDTPHTFPPVVMCDKACRTRKILDVSAVQTSSRTEQITIDAEGAFALARSEYPRVGETAAALIFAAGESKPLRTYKDVVFALWLPEDAPTPLGVELDLTSLPQAGKAVHRTPNPSYDCAKARSWASKTICTDADLADLDRELNGMYSARRDKMSKAEGAKFTRWHLKWKDYQRDLCEHRPNPTAQVACLKSVHEEQNQAIKRY